MHGHETTFSSIAVVAPLAAARLASARLVGSGSSSAKLTAKLAARGERPAPKGAASATGAVHGTLTGSSLTWRLTFSRLTGKAAGGAHPPRQARRRRARRGSALRAVRLGCPRHRQADSKTKAALLGGGAYVNVHTAKNAAGEIRGQIPGGVGTAPVRTTTTGDDDDDSGGGGYGGYG